MVDNEVDYSSSTAITTIRTVDSDLLNLKIQIPIEEKVHNFRIIYIYIK